ncbi:MAG: hypothetical protein IMX05_07725 [Hydrogenibacillus schlegelii]|nr:hypothetical protein [Hydrogenibacillus schlegelii]
MAGERVRVLAIYVLLVAVLVWGRPRWGGDRRPPENPGRALPLWYGEF